MNTEELENKKDKSARERAFERLAQRHEGLNFDDEEQLWGAIEGDYGGYEESLSRAEEVDRAMADRFENDPQFAQFFLDTIGGKSPITSIIERYGDSIRDYLDDPEKLDELSEANKTYLDRVSKEKQLEDQYNSNIEASLAIADELVGEGYSEEQIDEAFKLVLDDAQSVILGAISKDVLETKLKGLNYDADVAEAEQLGVVKAKNTKHTEKLKKASELDELPPMIDGRDAGVKEAKKVDPTIEGLDRISKNNDIWADMKRGR